MTYTQSYWQQLCKELLKTELHHHPSKGGLEETEKHIQWYRQTLDAYEQTFSEKAPDDIWPGPEIVYTAPCIELIPREKFRWQVFLYTIITFLLIGASSLFQQRGPVFLMLMIPYGIITLIWLYVLMRLKKQHVTQQVNSYFPFNSSPYQLAAFVYGSNRTCQMALVDLTNQGILNFDGKHFHLMELPPDSKHSNPLVSLLKDQFQTGAQFTYEEIHASLDHKLVQHPTLGYLRSWSAPFNWETWWLPALWISISLLRIIQGMNHGKPVSILVSFSIVFGFLSFAIIQSQLIRKLVRQAVLKIWKSTTDPDPGNQLINQYAWEGPALLVSLLAWPTMADCFKEANRKFHPTDDGGWSSGTGCSASGCSSGDGGGGCGSGCGGCGGGD